MQLEQHLKEILGDDCLIWSKAHAKYPSSGFKETEEVIVERMLKVIKEVKALKALNSH